MCVYIHLLHLLIYLSIYLSIYLYLYKYIYIYIYIYIYKMKSKENTVFLAITLSFFLLLSFRTCVLDHRIM